MHRHQRTGNRNEFGVVGPDLAGYRRTYSSLAGHPVGPATLRLR
ncbi:hypothetical protein AHiyo6_08450 [Arthrobacter sp. Hiyo6]|nr:hypothetical protein AHiyo6_08450 [Arthrobacter sp. Hiyo6]